MGEFNLTTFAEIIHKTAIGFEKFQTNIGKISTQKREKIYNCYGIPTDEKIITFCKTHPFGITINGCVFSDKAFYPRPIILNSTPVKGDLVPLRIEYADFGKYLIIQSDEKDAVFMRNKDKTYFITFSTLTNTNVTGCEIRKMLLVIQNHLCNVNATAKQDIKEIAEDYFERVSNEIKNDRLSLEFCNLLKGMITGNYFCLHAIDLLAESIYRLCNEDEYFSLINKYSYLISKEKYECYINIPQKFKDNLIADLSNPNLAFSDDYMNLIRYNLSKSKETEENQKYYIFACIRGGKIIEARLKIDKLIEKFGRETALIAEAFACFYGNKRMQEAVDMMNANQDIPEELFNITDALGFTPLHYALILNCKDAVRKLLGSKKFSKEIKCCQNNKIRTLLSYITVAYLQNTDLLACVISNASSEMMEISAQRRKLEKQIEKANSVIEKLERKAAKLGWEQNKEFIKDIFRGNFNLDDTAEDDDYYQDQQIISDSIQKLKNVIWNTNRELEKLEEIARKTYQAIVKQVSQTVKSLRCDESPVVELFLSLYKNDASNTHFTMQSASENSTAISNDASEHILLKILEITDSTSDFRVYDYEGFFFMLPDCIELSMPYRRIHIAEDGTINRFLCNNSSYISKYPKYGNSWFSEEAHNNMQILKREYRELAKKYHPDVCIDTDAGKIFAAIQNEYEKYKR